MKRTTVASRTGAASSSNTSVALTAVAFQDHIIKNLGVQNTYISSTHPRRPLDAPIRRPKAKSVIDTGLKPKPKPSASKQPDFLEEEKDEVLEKRTEKREKRSLAEKFGLIPSHDELSGKLNEQQWGEMKKKAGERGDYISPCVICKEELGTQQQLILSCSHTFHRNCLEAFERFTGRKCCPMCRKQTYEKRVIHEASRAYKIQCACKIQAAWKGYIVRKWYRNLRKTVAPKDPKLREKFYTERLEELTDRMLTMYTTDVDAFLRELDFSLHDSRKVMENFSASQMRELSTDEWDDISGTAFGRLDDVAECPICIGKLVGDKKLAVCSCTHVFHWSCLETFEQLSLNEFQICPVCRSCYQTKLM